MYRLFRGSRKRFEEKELKEAGLTHGQRKERTKLLLILAAADVFIEHGFNGSSIDLIAKSVGYSKGAVYFHFKNKEELLYGVMKYRSDMVFESIEKTSSDTELLKQLLDEKTQKKLLGNWYDRDKWVILYLEFLLYLQRKPEASAEFKKFLRNDRKKLIALIERKYKDAGKVPPMAPLEIAQIQEIVDIGFGVSRLLDPSLPQSLYEKLISVAR
jgi:AcrR family transcriptional regulator